METVSGQSSFSREVREQDEGRYASGNLVLWLAVIAVLVGLNFGSWSFCMWVFGQPEHPMNYALLTRLDKLEPIEGFTPVTAPRGKFQSVKDLYAQAYPFGPAELRAYNGILKRHYLKNYLERSDVTFVSGEFTIVSSRPLAEGDAFPSGFVVTARSTNFPDAHLELVLPSPEPPQDLGLEPGETLKVEESSTCAALLHVHRNPDDTMVLTAVPLVSREFEFEDGESIRVKPPGRIRMEPELWPLGEGSGSVERKPVSFSPEATEAAEAPESSEGATAAEAPESPEAP
jgi:hypothetical protein